MGRGSGSSFGDIVAVKIRFRTEAAGDVLSARARYDAQRPGLGDEFVRSLERVIELMVDPPDAFPEIGAGDRRALQDRISLPVQETSIAGDGMPRDSKTRVAAYGLVLEHGRILLCRISARVPAHAGRWTLPGGGIDFGEDPEDAMVREVREETGLVVCSSRIAAVDSLLISEGNSAIHNVRIIYFTEVIGGALSHELDGSTDNKGMPAPRPLRPTWPGAALLWC